MKRKREEHQKMMMVMMSVNISNIFLREREERRTNKSKKYDQKKKIQIQNFALFSILSFGEEMMMSKRNDIRDDDIINVPIFFQFFPL